MGRFRAIEEPSVLSYLNMLQSETASDLRSNAKYSEINSRKVSHWLKPHDIQALGKLKWHVVIQELPRPNNTLILNFSGNDIDTGSVYIKYL